MVSLEPVDYLVVGHITVDITAAGPVLGGSAYYAALTAQALGLRVGIVTMRGNELPLTLLKDIPVISGDSVQSTTFENMYTPGGRIQYLRHVAPRIDYALIPEVWQRAKIIHLAPVAQEIDSLPPANLKPTLLGLTPQGWLRSWDAEGRVSPCSWPQASEALARASAGVLSMEDIANDEETLEQLAHAARTLAVTEADEGVRLFWHGDSRRFRPPQVTEVDPTGAGDVFAASFFVRLLNTRDPWEAARFANRMAAISVTRMGVKGIPTPQEVSSCLLEVF